MTNNKSIDGLATHDAKLKAPVAKKVKKTTKVITVTEAPKEAEPLVTEELVESVVKTETENSETKQVEIKTSAAEDFLSPVQAFDFDGTDLKESKETVEEMRKSIEKPKKAQEIKEKPVKKSKNSRKSKKRKVITIIASVLIVVLIGLILAVIFWGNDIIAKITGGQGNIIDLLTFVDDTYEPLKTDANGRTNLLAFGTEGYDMDGTVGNSTHAGAQLTDSIMLISLDQNTGDIAMVSLPRDLKASPTCTATGKINEVYWCNNIRRDNEEGGATALMTEVGSILGVDIQYYAHLNWGSLVSIIDTLGGISVTLDENIHDQYYTGAVYEAGVTYNINGEQALGLARARHGTTGGDFSRGASQQKIIIGIKDKVFEKDLSLTDLLSLANTLGDNLRTNLSISEIKTVAHLTFEFDFDNMRTVSLWPDYMTTGMINGISYVLPRAGAGNYGNIQAYVKKMLSSDPRSYEEPTILVLNATDASGLATAEKEDLEAAGYSSITADNAPEGEYESGILLFSSGAKNGTKDILENYYHLTAKSYNDLPANIPKNYDFVIIINTETTEE